MDAQAQNTAEPPGFSDIGVTAKAWLSYEYSLGWDDGVVFSAGCLELIGVVAVITEPSTPEKKTKIDNRLVSHSFQMETLKRKSHKFTIKARLD